MKINLWVKPKRKRSSLILLRTKERSNYIKIYVIIKIWLLFRVLGNANSVKRIVYYFINFKLNFPLEILSKFFTICTGEVPGDDGDDEIPQTVDHSKTCSHVTMYSRSRNFKCFRSRIKKATETVKMYNASVKLQFRAEKGRNWIYFATGKIL